MEETKMFQKEADDKADGEEMVGKKMAPSKLRRKAPKAPLKLDHNMYNPSAKPTELSYAVDFSSRCAIPLLSPLIVGPPPPLPELEDNKVKDSTSCPDHGGNGGHNDKDKGAEPSSTPPPEGWKHPATVAPFTEPSSIFSFFQSHCYIAPHPTQ